MASEHLVWLRMPGLVARGGIRCTTVELKTNFLGAAREGKLTAAVFRCTQLVLWPRG
ncbi:hypothetical protein [Mycobacteroides abscessus]|uniref:hypothetical protein n=1 Tax=Mycobacteroides abscessus TaxID=36809 RepID=UPI0009D517B1|nr:hypothetical protein [Mycobacteroides abscessus]SKT46736.1 thioesterase superfamily 10 domain protein [Mycobacteroides abscessus subsp. massiliense]SKT90018.1 thioesterase superfamily 10 domain protein [Mycobacteroides abscessus subsp. massiliense]